MHSFWSHFAKLVQKGLINDKVYKGLASGFCGAQKHCVYQCFLMISHSWDLQKWRPQVPQIKMVKMVKKAFWSFWYEMIKMVKMTILTILTIFIWNGQNGKNDHFDHFDHFVPKWFVDHFYHVDHFTSLTILHEIVKPYILQGVG